MSPENEGARRENDRMHQQKIERQLAEIEEMLRGLVDILEDRETDAARKARGKDSGRKGSNAERSD